MANRKTSFKKCIWCCQTFSLQYCCVGRNMWRCTTAPGVRMAFLMFTVMQPLALFCLCSKESHLFSLYMPRSSAKSSLCGSLFSECFLSAIVGIIQCWLYLFNGHFITISCLHVLSCNFHLNTIYRQMCFNCICICSKNLEDENIKPN